jgi:hypothetical protein
MAATKTVKQVNIIATYYHKTDGKLNGIISYLVRSSNGKSTYCTTLINGKATGCSCKARGNCYHKKQLEQKHLERQSLAEQFAAKSVPTWTVQLVAGGKLEVPAKVRKQVLIKEPVKSPVTKIIETAITAQVPTPNKDMMSAALTTNRGFQMMR